MAHPPFRLGPGARVLLADLGVAPADVLRAAGLPGDLLTHTEVTLPPSDYYALFTALDELVTGADLAVAIADALSLESFDAPIFAAMCSPDLRTAADRIAVHKRLCWPLRLDVDHREDGLDLGIVWPATEPPPEVLAGVEVLFWVALARLGTRTRVVPLEVEVPRGSRGVAAWEAWLDCRVRQGAATRVRFSSMDARRPFLTANARMWEFFAPELRQRLAELDANATTGGRVRAALVELLPAGAGTASGVARELGMSTRTLQRRLTAEDATFAGLLADVRENLAHHYLTTSALPIVEIAFLLGYDDPNSFHRAFHQWTGHTPMDVRRSVSA
ncbi:helix-turn-helix domain-containing protein [Nocardioides sp. GCM10027113]|uniref:AraC family transcriptional regulator n=1 Tax=unclassified Nocardioides TaxID=2615069 RepID=UPI00361E972F